jgi:hypothetical protein
MAYKWGVVSVGTSPTLIATPSSVPENGGILIQNVGSTVLYLGGPTVTAGTTSTGGLQVAANATVNVPVTGSSTEALYGVSTAALNVAYLYPS